MEHPYWVLIGVMLAAGLGGGWLNYALGRTNEPQAAPKLLLLQSLLGGIVASFTVPLFLNMISSALVDSIRGTPGGAADQSKLFVFAGFCLIAAVSSKSFISNLSDRILSETKATRKQVQQIRQEVDPIIDKETEREPQDVKPMSASLAVQIPSGRTENATKVLEALANGRFTLRTQTGISVSTGIQKDIVAQTLEELAKIGFARGVKVLVQGKPKVRWCITERGRTAVGTS